MGVAHGKNEIVGKAHHAPCLVHRKTAFPAVHDVRVPIAWLSHVSASATRQYGTPYGLLARRTENIRHGGTEGDLFRKGKLRLLVFEADHKDPRAVLRQAKVTGLHDLIVEAVAQGFEAVADGSEGPSLVVGDKVPHVFEEKRLRLLGFEDANDLEKDGTAWVSKAFLFSRKAKWLAREASAEDVEVGYVLWVYGHDVLGEVATIEQLRGQLFVICFVGCAGELVLLAGEYAPCARIMECQMETSHASEQVDEGVLSFLWLCSHRQIVPDMGFSHNRKKGREGMLRAVTPARVYERPRLVYCFSKESCPCGSAALRKWGGFLFCCFFFGKMKPMLLFRYKPTK